MKERERKGRRRGEAPANLTAVNVSANVPVICKVDLTDTFAETSLCVVRDRLLSMSLLCCA